MAAVELVGPIKTVVAAVTERCPGEETESPVTPRLTRRARYAQKTDTNTQLSKTFNICRHIETRSTLSHISWQ